MRTQTATAAGIGAGAVVVGITIRIPNDIPSSLIHTMRPRGKQRWSSSDVVVGVLVGCEVGSSSSIDCCVCCGSSGRGGYGDGQNGTTLMFVPPMIHIFFTHDVLQPFFAD